MPHEEREVSQESALRLLRQAERTNARRDREDRASGFTTPGDGPPDDALRTALSALHAGLVAEDWNCVAEATCMLADLAGSRPWISTPRRQANRRTPGLGG